MWPWMFLICILRLGCLGVNLCMILKSAWESCLEAAAAACSVTSQNLSLRTILECVWACRFKHWNLAT